jgi:hypothetical protein
LVDEIFRQSGVLKRSDALLDSNPAGYRSTIPVLSFIAAGRLKDLQCADEDALVQ